MISYLLIIIGIIWLIFASIFDIKTREIPDWLNYSLISIGLGVRLIYSFDDYWFFLYGLIGVGIAFVFGSAMYYGRQWGGGDVKLLIGMGAMFGSNPGLISLDLPFFLVFIVNMFIAGAVTGILYGVFLAIKHRKDFLKEIKKLDFKYLYFTLVFILFLILLNFLYLDNLNVTLLFSLFLLFFVSLFGFMKAVEKSSLYKMINVSKLTEGDMLVNNIIYKKKIIINYNKPGLTMKDIKKLKGLKIKKILIKEGMPFAPNFLIGLLITIFYGSLLSLLW